MTQSLLINGDWRFAYGEHRGAQEGADDTGWFDVGIPHSFSLPDFREEHFYVGFGCYSRVLDVPAEWLGQWIALEFLGVFQTTEVFVNGRSVGEHRGGYTPFLVDISDAVHEGENRLFVRVDNTWDARLAPRAGDYSFTGGIYRDVSLLVGGSVRVDWHGVGVTTPGVSAASSGVEVVVDIVNDSDLDRVVRVEADVRESGREGEPLAHTEVELPARSTSRVTLSGTVGEPRLWHPDHPELYAAEIRVLENGSIVDEQSTTFGFRWFEFTADRGFFLNGEHLELHGANVHQNHGGWADAVTRAGIRRDVALVKGAGFNIIRGSHYPHHLAFADECDRQGLLFWSELHFWGIGGEDIEGWWFASAYPVTEGDEAQFEQSLHEALTTMIRTQRNHPSIITWSVGNEAFFTDDRVIDKAKALTSALVERVHDLDPTRPASVGGAQRQGFDLLGDVAGYNGDGAELFDDPGIPNLVAEYHGVAGRGPGSFEVEWEYGVESNPPWRSGKILWSAFHYKTIVPDAGRYGLVDYWRLPRRSYHWYRQKFLGIAPPAFPEPGTAASISIVADADVIGVDGTDDTQIVVRFLDADGHQVVDEKDITLTVVEGEGILPSGREITLSENTESLSDGAGAVEFRSYVPGVSVIHATAEGLPAAEIRVRAEGRQPRRRRVPALLAPPAPWVTPPPSRHGHASLAQSRPASASSAQRGHESSHVTTGVAGTSWRAASEIPGEWVMASLEFPYDISRVEVHFAEPADGAWELQTTVDARTFEAVSHTDSGSASTVVDIRFPPRRASAVRLRFPDRPIAVEHIRVY